MDVLSGIATNLASALIVASAGRLRDEVLGEEQERALGDVFQRATAAMLVEFARTDVENREMVDRFERQFGKFFGDPWVAETLVSVALDSEPPPVDRLRARFSEIGFDPEGFPIGFDRAMGVFVSELAIRLEEASKGGFLAPLVNRADMRTVRRLVEDLARERGSTGPDVEELERESLARCAVRWEAAGLSPEEARTLATDKLVGLPGPQLREALRRPVAVVAGEVGAGKSLLLDRLLQRAIVRLREEPNAPLPTYIEAWEVEGRLRDVVLQKTSVLGDARRRGAAVFVDGAEEAGRTQARRLVEEARILVDTWPNTTVVVAGRPLPELAGDREMIAMPELTDEETKALIERLTGKELTVGVMHRWPKSIAEAVRRPLFAVLLAVDFRERGYWNPRSIGELLSNLVDRALEKSEDVVDVDQLRNLAVASIDSEGAPVRAAEVGTGEDVRRLRETGLVAGRNGMIAFSLHILAEWFAAQALEHGMVDSRVLASDLARLERWRYPLAIAVGTFGHSRVREILAPVVEEAPAFASQVVEEGITRSGLSDEGPPTSPEEFGRQLRANMNSWVEGIGPLAPLIAPVREDGSLCPLGVSGSRERASRRSWYRGEDDLGEVVPLHEHLPQMLPNWGWPDIRGVGTHRQAAWTWKYALEDLRSELRKVLKERRLPISGGLLAEEAAWDAAREMRKRFDKKNYRERDPIPLEALEKYMNLVGWDRDAITFGNLWSRRGRNYELRYLKDKIRLMRDASEEELCPPWPSYDRGPGDPGYTPSGGDSTYVWEWYSSEAILARARVILEGALEGYRWFVEEYFPRLAPHLRRAVVLLACLTGTLIPSRANRWTHSTSPYVAWYLDPLPPGSENDIRVEIGEERASREHMLGVLRRTQSMRLEAAAWISTPEYADQEFFGKTPAAELAYEWLWNDLKRVSWVDGMFNRRYS